jgi:hypothetical protein
MALFGVEGSNPFNAINAEISPIESLSEDNNLRQQMSITLKHGFLAHGIVFLIAQLKKSHEGW